jgi:hypothetical protein
MPIAINGSGTITGISVGGIPDGTVDTDVLAANAVTFAKIGTTEQGQLCKAWVNFNGTGTVAIRASYNVSSITDNGVGDYTVNFTTALADANYASNVSIGAPGTGGTALNINTITSGSGTESAPTTTAFRFSCMYGFSFGNMVDTKFVSVAIFR